METKMQYNAQRHQYTLTTAEGKIITLPSATGILKYGEDMSGAKKALEKQGYKWDQIGEVSSTMGTATHLEVENSLRGEHNGSMIDTMLCDNFSEYELYLAEEPIYWWDGNIGYGVTPDCVLRHKKTGEYLLMEVKSYGTWRGELMSQNNLAKWIVKQERDRKMGRLAYGNSANKHAKLQ